MHDLRIAVATASFRQPIRAAIDSAARCQAQGVQFDARHELKPGEFGETGRRQLLYELRERDLTVAALSEPDESGCRLYRTGDHARFLADGQLLFTGRQDAQIKLRGHRIEAGEIESVIVEHASVDGCVVILREDQPGRPSLSDRRTW